MKKQPTKLLKVVFIDPYKKEARMAEIGRDLKTWYQVLRCDCVECQRLGTDGVYSLDIWYDDEFLLKEPVGPSFQIADLEGGLRTYSGYAFLASSNSEGDTISTSFGVPDGLLESMLHIRWEKYEKRLGPDAFLDLRLRTPELEMPGRFKFMDICPDCGKVHQ